METTPNLALRLLVQSQSQKELTVNEALCRLDALQAGVISRSLATPPSSPTDGMTYIVGTSATAAWSGKDANIAYYAGGWNFIIPKEGMNLWVKDEAILYRYDGSTWVKNISLTPGSLGTVNVTSPQSGDILQHTGSQWQNTPLPAGRRNLLLNGSFTIWQRNSSFSSPAGTYTADRFISETGTGGASTISRQAFSLGQSDVPGEPIYYLRHQQTTAASTAPALSQRIESVRSLAGRNAVVSFYAKASATLTLTPSLIQCFGTGGSPSANVTQTLSGRSISTSWTRIIIPVTLGSISGKVLGSNNDDYVQLRLALPTGSSFTFEIAQMQLESGLIATPYELTTPESDLVVCQRYYEKSFAQATVPAHGTGAANAYVFSQPAAAGIGVISGMIRHGRVKRATPTLTIYSIAGTTGQIYNSSRATSASSTNIYINNESMMSISCVTPAGSAIGDQCGFHYTAEAEL